MLLTLTTLKGTAAYESVYRPNVISNAETRIMPNILYAFFTFWSSVYCMLRERPEMP